MKIDVLTPTVRDFQPPPLDQALREIVCHWRTSGVRPLSYARRDLLRQADNEWSLFIDDDVRWKAESILDLANCALDHDVGAVETQIIDDPQGPGSAQMHRGLHFSSEKVTRGWTGFTLVKSSACKDWNPPPVNTFEDESLRRFLANKKLRWIRNMNISVTHQISYHTPRQFFEDGINASKVLSRKSIAWTLAKYPFFLRHGRRRTASYTQFVKGLLSGFVFSAKEGKEGL